MTRPTAAPSPIKRPIMLSMLVTCPFCGFPPIIALRYCLLWAFWVVLRRLAPEWLSASHAICPFPCRDRTPICSPRHQSQDAGWVLQLPMAPHHTTTILAPMTRITTSVAKRLSLRPWGMTGLDGEATDCTGRMQYPWGMLPVDRVARRIGNVTPEPVVWICFRGFISPFGYIFNGPSLFPRSTLQFSNS